MPPQNPMQPQAPNYGQNTKAAHHRQSFLIPFVVFLVLTLTFGGLFGWAYMGMQDYKNNVTPKINDAVKIAIQEESSRKDNEFIEKEKIPVKTYTGPDTFGRVTFNYPKTWSAYVIHSEKGSSPVDGYFHPDIVPDVAGGTAYALRIRVLDKTYDTHIKSLESKIKQGKVTMIAYNPLNQKNITGARLDGEVNTGQKDHMVILPLRDKTIEISTESDQFKGDFEKIILETLNFTP